MNKPLLVCYIIVFFFGIMGTFFVGTILHEYSHMKDLRGANVSLGNETIRINIPLEWKKALLETEGVYSVKTKLSEHDIIEKKMKYTELKAYAISISLIFLFMFALFFIEWKMEGYKTFRYFDEQRIKNNPIIENEN